MFMQRLCVSLVELFSTAQSYCPRWSMVSQYLMQWSEPSSRSLWQIIPCGLLLKPPSSLRPSRRLMALWLNSDALSALIIKGRAEYCYVSLFNNYGKKVKERESRNKCCLQLQTHHKGIHGISWRKRLQCGVTQGLIPKYAALVH